MKRALSQTGWDMGRFFPVIILMAVAISFGALAAAQFCLIDDPATLAHNPRLDPPTLQSIAYYWSHSEYYLYIPLTYTLWGVLAAIARYSPLPNVYALNPGVFHVANVVLHALGGLAIYGLLTQILKDRRSALFGALLFVLHPIQVEAVAWASGMKDVLCGVLSLAAIWQYVLFARQPIRRANYVVATILFLLALLSKPSAIVVPAIAFAIDAWLIRRPIRQVAVQLLPWIFLSALFAIIASQVQPDLSMVPVPLRIKPFVAADALAFYLDKLVWPFNLAPDYGRSPAAVIREGWIYLTWLLPAAMMILLIVGRRRFPELPIAGMIFVAGVAPVLGLVPFLYQQYSTTADHYLYLSMLGPALAAGVLIDRFARPAIIFGATVAIVFLAVLTMLQATVWADDFSLFSHTLAVNPDSRMALQSLANTYFEAGQPERAEPLYRRSLELYPEYPQAYEGLSVVLAGSGRLDEAIRLRQRELDAIQKMPLPLQGEMRPRLLSMASDLISVNRLSDAEKYLQAALRSDPNDADAQQMLAQVERQLKAQSSTAPATTQQ